jgi:SAM-dependent methyltransferase
MTEEGTGQVIEPRAANGCVVCSNTVNSPLYGGLSKCQDCGHVFAKVDLTDEELYELYNSDYFCGGEYRDYVADKKVAQRNFELRFEVLKFFLQASRHKYLFEVGSAYGFFLDLVQDNFDAAQGIEINEAGARYAIEQLNLSVIHGDFLTHDFGDQAFDVVCMWDTIEHLRRPDLYLQKISQHTKHGALLALTTGDIASFSARFRKEKWRLIHPPTHVHYFSEATLARMLDRCGFDVIYKRYCGFYRNAGNAAHNILVLRYRSPILFKLLQRSRVTSLNFYLNLHDITYVIARRR